MRCFVISLRLFRLHPFLPLTSTFAPSPPPSSFIFVSASPPRSFIILYRSLGMWCHADSLTRLRIFFFFQRQSKRFVSALPWSCSHIMLFNTFVFLFLIAFCLHQCTCICAWAFSHVGSFTSEPRHKFFVLIVVSMALFTTIIVFEQSIEWMYLRNCKLFINYCIVSGRSSARCGPLILTYLDKRRTLFFFTFPWRVCWRWMALSIFINPQSWQIPLKGNPFWSVLSDVHNLLLLWHHR